MYPEPAPGGEEKAWLCLVLQTEPNKETHRKPRAHCPQVLRRKHSDYYGKEMHGVVLEKESGPCRVERDRSVEGKGMRSRLMWVACLPARAMVMSGTRVWTQGPAALSVWVDVCGSYYHQRLRG